MMSDRVPKNTAGHQYKSDCRQHIKKNREESTYEIA